MNSDTNLILVEEVFKQILKRFVKEPYYYFYEEDIRADFAFNFISQIKPIEYMHIENKISTLPLKFEYPSSVDDKKRHDIVFLKLDSGKDIYKLDISIAIELKLGSKSYDRCAKFKKDIAKLARCKNFQDFTGIALYFFQDKIDYNLFNTWFKDTIESFDKININQISIEKSAINTFIVIPEEYVFKAKTYNA